jgi:hypothetical protein
MQFLFKSEASPGPEAVSNTRYGLFAAEIGLVAIILGLLVATVLRDVARPSVVDWGGFAPTIAATLALIALGGFIRVRRNMRQLSAFAVSFGIFTGFSTVVAIFIFQVFPFQRPTIDQSLIAIDAALGYDWPTFLMLLAEWPAFGRLLGWVYSAAIPQLIVVIVGLAILGRERALHRFLWVGVGGMAVTVGLWQFLPSLGSSPYHDIPQSVSAIGLVVDANYAERLLRYAAEGVPVIRPGVLIGVIAFPSFHMFMALLGFWFARGTVLFAPMAVVSLLMVPATLGHGGHHLSDLIASVILFSCLAAAAARFLPDRRDGDAT